MDSEQEIIVGSIVFDSFPSDAPKVGALKSKNNTNPKKKETIISQDTKENEKEGKKMKIALS